MPWKNNDETLSGQPFQVGDTTYSGNVVNLWSTQELEDIGLVWVNPVIIEPMRRTIPKSVIQERVNIIGKLDDVLTILNSQAIMFARWFAPDWPNVYFDDEGMLQLLTIVGCTPEEIETITA